MYEQEYRHNEGISNIRSMQAYTCPNGIDCNNNVIDGYPDQVVCGQDLNNWQCTLSGWVPLQTPCICNAVPPPSCAQGNINIPLINKCIPTTYAIIGGGVGIVLLLMLKK